MGQLSLQVFQRLDHPCPQKVQFLQLEDRRLIEGFREAAGVVFKGGEPVAALYPPNVAVVFQPGQFRCRKAQSWVLGKTQDGLGGIIAPHRLQGRQQQGGQGLGFQFHPAVKEARDVIAGENPLHRGAVPLQASADHRHIAVAVPFFPHETGDVGRHPLDLLPRAWGGGDLHPLGRPGAGDHPGPQETALQTGQFFILKPVGTLQHLRHSYPYPALPCGADQPGYGFFGGRKHPVPPLLVGHAITAEGAGAVRRPPNRQFQHAEF